jgi:glutaconate CoA-transferase subunit A
MSDKTTSIEQIVGALADGMTIGIGGWATRRKPMALVRAIARSALRDLTVVSYGGPDVGILAAAGKLRRLVFGFVSLDHIPLDPHFRAARQAGLPVWELDEGMLHWGLRAAAMRLPFLPTRAGLGTDIARQPEFRTITSPYDDAEALLAMPAIHLDAALLHVHRADRAGNTLTLSPDPFFDALMARAARQVFVTTEQLVDTAALDMQANARCNLFERALVTGVALAPYGAHPTSAAPDYQLDLPYLKTYAAAAADPASWDAYRSRFIDVSSEDYLCAVGGASSVHAQPVPAY